MSYKRRLRNLKDYARKQSQNRIFQDIRTYKQRKRRMESFCKAMFTVAAAKNEAESCVGGVDRLIKEAAAHPGGIYGMAGDLARKAAPVAGKAVGELFGDGSAVAKGVQAVVPHAHTAAAALLANKVLGGRPATVLKSYMPWDSQEKQVRQNYGVGALL